MTKGELLKKLENVNDNAPITFGDWGGIFGTDYETFDITVRAYDDEVIIEKVEN